MGLTAVTTQQVIDWTTLGAVAVTLVLLIAVLYAVGELAELVRFLIHGRER